MRNFKIWDVSAVKICKKSVCKQSASASGELCPPDPLLGLRPWVPLGDFRPQTLRAIAPQMMKIPVVTTAATRSVCCAVFYMQHFADSIVHRCLSVSIRHICLDQVNPFTADPFKALHLAILV